MAFKARTTAPSATDKNWIHTSKGGKNSCILVSGNSVLPNCVGYAWGRFMEILGSTPKLSRGNAEDWWAYKDGYKRGQTPKLGAVICYKKGKTGTGADGAGHVAIVEKIYSDGSILIGESGYKSFRFRTMKLPKGYKYFSGYTLQGFIYNPAVKDSETTLNTSAKKSNDTIADEVIAGKWGNGDTRTARLKAAGYNPATIQSIVNKKLSGKKTTSVTKKSNATIAKEVIAGKWGNGAERKKKLEAAGYDYDAVQKAVNSLLK